MAFRFQLEPLLRFRQSIERQRALRLREVSFRVARMAGILGELDQFLADSEQTDDSRLREGRTGAELHFATFSRENLESLQAQIEKQLEELQAERQRAAEEYQAAYREREVLNALRDRQKRIHEQEELRRLQRDLDETFLIQRWRRG